MAKKRRRVPEVLRRVFGDRVRPLAETLLYLLPKSSPSPEKCLCRGRVCLGCGGFPFLLRHEDGSDYRQLLNRCFCVVSPDAPELTDFYCRREWTQRLIVRNTMELVMDRSHPSDNVLCKGYDKRSRFSVNGELLCSSAWNLLLTRVGESAMTFLLNFSSIFIPLPTNNHYQVTGPPLDKFLQNPVSHKPIISSSASKDQQALLMGDHAYSGCKLKRKRTKLEEKQEGFFIPEFHQGVPLASTYPIRYGVYGKPQKNISPFNWNRGMQVTGAGVSKNHFNADSCEDNSNTFLPDRCSISHVPIGQNMFDGMAQAALLKACKSFLILEECSQKNGREDMKGNADSTSAVPLGHAISLCTAEVDGKFTPLGTESFSTSEFCPKSRKHGRLFSWQRHRKRKKANTLVDSLNSCSSIVNDKESLGRMLQQKSDINLYYKPGKLVRKISYSGVNQVSGLVNPYPTLIAESNLHQENISYHDAVNCENSEKLFHPNTSSACFNCSMLQSSPKFTTRVKIRKKHMFYNLDSSSSIFPRDHILNRLKPNNSGAHALFKHIFDVTDESLNTDVACCFHSNDDPAVKSGCLYHSLLRIFKKLIRNARKCHHMEYLHRHCSAPSFRRCSSDNWVDKSEAVKRKLLLKKLEDRHILLQKSSENLSSQVSYGTADVNKQRHAVHVKNSVDCDFQFDQNGSYCRHDEVVSFLWAATRNMVPVDLLGNYSNWRLLRRNISKFVRLQRFERFCLRQCIHGLQISKFSFLAEIPNHRVCYCFNRVNSSMVPSGESKNHWILLKHKLFHSWIYWFFSHIIVPILSANFYITERESGRHEVFYYLKPVWSRLVSRTITSLKEQNYSPVDYKLLEKIMSSRPFGFSRVRFLPKEKGMRLLANLRAPSKEWLPVKSCSGHHIAKIGYKAKTHLRPGNSNRKGKFVHFRSVNSVLHDVYAILKRIKIESPQMLGASVFDYNDIYQMLYQFLSRLKNGLTTMPKVYIVVSDVLKAFDNIDQDRLIDIMKNVIHKEEYHVRTYAQVICSKGPMQVVYGHVCLNSSEDNSIVNSLASIRSCPSHGVLIDQGAYRKIKQVEILHLLHEHVKSNILQLGQGFYRQNSGIAQGSVLSSLLCSLYYGHLESTIIFPFLGKIRDLTDPSFKNREEPNLSGCTHACCRCSHFTLSKHPSGKEQSKPFNLDNEEKESIWKSNKWQDAGYERENDTADDCFPIPMYLLLRLIDDFIFISTSKRQAMSYFNRLCRGFREYNCSMNSEKFCLNFDVDNQSPPIPNRRYLGADGISFLPWSGLLVNCRTLEVQADYTRYLGTHLRSALTVHAHTQVEERLKEKLCSYMRPKCHPIFYDSNINSPAVVRLNAYQAFLLCAMKFHCYVCATARNTRDIGPKKRLEIIQKSFSYMHRLIKKRMYGMRQRGLNVHPVLKLKKAEIIWLGLSAYIRVLKKKQSRHAKLLSLLKAKFDNLGKVDCDPSHLKYAVDDSHSSLFWKIKY